ncbi:F510_1955 family glycosylhydrolase [Cellulomonas sp. NS3]|uniref:F510_1955 family glycosylhydrolase n=1 Tax=Cellulomonas sp. NS3 TaxID=2973977 RepID=UPI0021636988|nr:sialidase family protein [Cellulomonas sp. NS3]
MNRARRRLTATVIAFGVTLAVAACAQDPGPATAPTGQATTASDGHAHAHADETDSAGLPGAHTHGVGINPADDLVYLATHEGLFRYDETGPTRVGPVIDLMGFTVAGPDHFYASGHPGAGTDMPNPVGLIESTDAGETWTALSREGESDFHAMTASSTSVVAFDGAALQATSDGVSWGDLDVPVPPFAMDVSPDGRTIVVTSHEGPVRSTDAGASWDRLDGAPLLQVVDWADTSTVVGLTPDGDVTLSEDAGATWAPAATLPGPPQAVAARRAADGTLRVVAVTQDTVLESVDLGAGFGPLPGA